MPGVSHGLLNSVGGGWAGMAESEKPKKKSKGYEHKIVKKILKAKDNNGQLILTDGAFTSAIEVCV